eukprot:1149509-Pelagomonas_calceolata.AAC.4
MHGAMLKLFCWRPGQSGSSKLLLYQNQQILNMQDLWWLGSESMRNSGQNEALRELLPSLADHSNG